MAVPPGVQTNPSPGAAACPDVPSCLVSPLHGLAQLGIGPRDREGAALRNTEKSCPWMSQEKGHSWGYGGSWGRAQDTQGHGE